ncbi:MAG: LytTR family DNA-binding domain-containing protein, partial [Cyclobacteriaceae bacterium]
YLLKPINKDDLAASIAKYNSLKSQFSAQQLDMSTLLDQIQREDKQYKPRFLVRQGEKLISVETGQIAYFYTRNGVVHLVTKEGRNYLMDQTLEEIGAQLDPTVFHRVNRQYVVQFSSIVSTERYFKSKLIVDVNPPADEPIIISAEKAAEFKKWLGM